MYFYRLYIVVRQKHQIYVYNVQCTHTFDVFYTIDQNHNQSFLYFA